MISSSEFRAQNTILSTRHLVPVTVGSTQKDFIDLNRNGKVDGYTRSRDVNLYYSEPALSLSLETIKNYGDRRDEQVVTEGEIGDKLSTVSVRRNTFDQSERSLFSSEGSSLGDVALQLEPLEKDVKWAIDTNTHEFLVYQPKH